MAELPGSLGKYRIERLLGRGAMGTVYQALDPDIQRRVAIKVLHPHLLDTSQGAALRERFRREAQAAARCHHPNIVTLFDLGREKDTDFIVSELIEGDELKSFLESGTRFSLQEIGLIIGGVLKGLAGAHAQGIVHRDIKPGNILLLNEGSVKIADFGVARLEASDLTLAGFMIGTPGYMSPEALRGEVVDQRADLYSTGVILLELLSGQRAKLNPLNDHEFDETLKAIVSGITPALDPALLAVVHQALAIDPQRRFASANDFATALTQAMGLISLMDESLSMTLSETLIGQRPHLTNSTNANNTNAQPSWSQETLEQLGHVLATWLGPMAPRLIKHAASTKTTASSLIEELAKTVTDPEEKALFIQRARQSLALDSTHGGSNTRLGGSSPTRHPAHITQDELTRLQGALTKYLGPMAAALIRRSIPKVSSRQELEQLLAENIPDTSERQAFLAEIK